MITPMDENTRKTDALSGGGSTGPESTGPESAGPESAGPENAGQKSVRERTPEEAARRRRRRARRRKRRRRQRLIRRTAAAVVILLAALFLVRCGAGKGNADAGAPSGKRETLSAGAETSSAGIGADEGGAGESTAAPATSASSASSTTSASSAAPASSDSSGTDAQQIPALFSGYAPRRTSATQTIAQTQDMQSNYAVLINGATGEITAGLNESARIVPASMTKILTLYTAVKELEKKGQDADGTYSALNDSFTIPIEITDFAYQNGGSSVGFAVGETVTVRDLLYGTILPSGADAAAGLAVYTSGSQEAFADLMNQNLAELGLSGTSHFTNCVGFYDPEHYTTPSDMAMILKAAVEDPLCREVLSAHQYTTSPTEQHPEGISLSNWFLRRIEDKETHGTVLCAKTGYVRESGNCAASFALSDGGTPYFCVTADAHSAWRCIYDHVTIYSTCMD